MVLVDMRYTAIVLSLAILTFALLFPTFEGFIDGLENDNLPNKSRTSRKLLVETVPNNLDNKFREINIYTKD